MSAGTWAPTTVLRFIKAYPTSTSVMRVDTDAGEGFLKPLGNPEGPQVLACELVGTLLAEWMGLPTLDHAVVQVTEDDELPLAKGGFAAPGPAFITRAEEGFPWGGDVDAIMDSRRPQDAARLVALDTWIRNCDRYRPEPNLRVNRDNVFLARREGEMVLVAMDHTHSFTCGAELTRRLANMDIVRDRTPFGYFPEFRDLVAPDEIAACETRLGEMRTGTADGMLAAIPDEWQVEATVRTAWRDFIVDRAGFLSANLAGILWPAAG